MLGLDAEYFSCTDRDMWNRVILLYHCASFVLGTTMFLSLPILAIVSLFVLGKCEYYLLKIQPKNSCANESWVVEFQYKKE